MKVISIVVNPDTIKLQTWYSLRAEWNGEEVVTIMEQLPDDWRLKQGHEVEEDDGEDDEQSDDSWEADEYDRRRDDEITDKQWEDR